MKKNNLMIMVTTLLFPISLNLVSCGNNEISIPDVVSGKDTIINEIKEEPNRVDAKTAVFATLGKINNATTYKKTSTSTIESNKGIINYTQKATCEMIKNDDEFYVDSISKSAFVNMEHETFYKHDKIAYRNEKGEIKNTTYSNYLNVYGITPEKLLSGQIFNQDTILYAKLDSYTNDEFTYTIVLDKKTTNELLKYQIKEFGNLNSYPSFVDNTEFTLKIKGDYTPISYSYTAAYNISIPVLGELTCSETTNAVFSSFNESVSIVDSSLFNKAINEEPTIINPSQTNENDKNVEAVFKALLNYNLKQGIAISGDITISDNISTPLRINGKVNMDKVLSNDLANAFDLTLKLSNNLSITYHENKLYVNCLNNKYAFALNTLSSSQTPSIKDIDLNDFITINKDKDVEGLYEIKLNDNIKTLIFEALNGSGIIDISSLDDFDISFNLYIYNNQINTLKANVTVYDNTFVSADFVIGNDIYVLDDLSSYTNTIKKSFDISVALSSLDEILNGTIAFEYDTLNTNPLDAITALISISLTDSIKSLLSMASSFSSDVPEWLNSISSSDEITILLKNGKLYAVTTKDNQATLFKQLGDFTTSNVKASTLDLDISISDILPSLPYLFDVNFIQGNLTIRLNKDIVSLLNSDALWGGIDEFLLNSMGTQGILIYNMLGLYKPLSDIRIDVPLLNSSTNLQVVVETYELSSTDVFNESLTYDVSTFLKIETKINNSFTIKEIDINTLASNEEKADQIRSKISYLKNTFELTDNYLKDLEDFKNEYETLSDEVKALVYNSEVKSFFSSTFIYDYLLKQYNDEKSLVDKFAIDCVDTNKKLTTLNNTYSKFTSTQKKYLTTKYNNELKIYIQRRYENEANDVNNIVASIDDSSMKNIDSLNDEELYDYLKVLIKLNKQINNLVDGSINKGHIETFNNVFENTIDRYVSVYEEKAINALNEIKRLQYANYSIVQLNEYYTTWGNFYEKYCSSISSDISSYLTAYHPSFTTNMYKVAYYMSYNGKGFIKAAVMASENEINDILDNNYDIETLTLKINELKTLWSHNINVDNISNYDQIVSIINNLDAKDMKEKINGYTLNINELLEENITDDIIDFVEWGDLDSIKNYLKKLSFEQKVICANEISSLNEAISKLEEVYNSLNQ